MRPWEVPPVLGVTDVVDSPQSVVGRRSGQIESVQFVALTNSSVASEAYLNTARLERSRWRGGRRAAG
jgi:hypothetical protein